MGETNTHKVIEEGRAAFTHGEPLKAAQYFRAAVTAEPGYVPGWRYLGFALNAGQKPDEAVTSFEKAVRLDSSDSESHFGMALALTAMNQLSRAITEFERAYHLHPDHPSLMKPFITVLLKHAKTLSSLGNVEWAKKYLDRAYELEPENGDVLVAMVDYACILDNHDLAVRMIEELEEAKPDYPGLQRLKDDFGLRKQKERGWLY